MDKAQKKDIARGFFLNSSMNRKEIASAVQTTEKTLRSWIEKEGWEDLKNLKSITRESLLKDAYEQLANVNAEIKALQPGDLQGRKLLFDAKAILGKEIDRLSDSPLHVYIGVFDEFISYLSKTNPIKLQETTALCYEFIEEVNQRKK